jgi:N-acylneuraminate cytidylyltransferase
MKIIAVIPARGGSKRIPKKNIIDFMGKPLINWTIEAAKNSKLFDRIVVSTDCSEIAEVAKGCGVEVPYLRDSSSDDNSVVSEATLVAIRQTEKFYKEKYDIVVQLMANAPLRDEYDIQDHVNHFVDSKKNFQISSFKFGWMNPWWSFKLKNEGGFDWMLIEGIGKRSQDLDELFCPTGVIWIAKVDALKKAKTFYGPDFNFFEINWKHAVDIDNFEDLEFAKAVFILNK